ncbi:carbohydrate ABC transporter permease [Pseudoleptotrichia goodfellowii]|uniref:ABC transporter, permease protein n=1 Tax=Pseudoleptotrichia goodfellowii F0264 TaxID=596323 RepID=D0GLZ4_9FUSO|nr:carbohydrate ABC transporter permease [Pseudoleptotrichia goodfellowii]EEY34922.1 ABC transporter, permease protein [Pseudoleptotrichia goodfellowii F0264]MBF4805336.1 carbohydrate ABC transporter permease [Pseudoleptotrichia goodfellowii]
MKETKKDKFIYYITVFFIILFSVGPIFWCFLISITPEGDLLKNNTRLLPETITFINYKNLFSIGSKESETLLNGLSNSMYLSFVTVLIGMPLSVITGYTLARYKFKYKNLIIGFILLTIVIPVFTTIIPIYSFFMEHSMLDSMFWTSVIFISAFIPLNIWIIMNYFRELPEDLWEAAAIEGANERQLFFQIALPLAMPIVLTSSLIIFLMSWKQYIIPMLLLSSHNNKVLTLIMSEFMTRDAVNYSVIAMSGIIVIIPPLLASMVFRKYLVSGLTAGSVKE